MFIYLFFVRFSIHCILLRFFMNVHVWKPAHNFLQWFIFVHCLKALNLRHNVLFCSHRNKWQILEIAYRDLLPVSTRIDLIFLFHFLSLAQIDNGKAWKNAFANRIWSKCISVFGVFYQLRNIAFFITFYLIAWAASNYNGNQFKARWARFYIDRANNLLFI